MSAKLGPHSDLFGEFPHLGSEQQNLALVQEFYAALKRGGVTLNTLADDVAWFVPGPKDLIPLAGQREGARQVVQILATLSKLQDAEQFDIREFVAEGDKGIALGHYRWRIKSNGKFYESDWAHAFGIRNGKSSSFQEYVDTDAWAAAYHRFQAHAGP